MVLKVAQSILVQVESEEFTLLSVLCPAFHNSGGNKMPLQGQAQSGR